MTKFNSVAAQVSLHGKTAVITGAGQGNGRALATGLASCGARIVATDMNPQTLSETVALVAAEGAEVWAYALDVTDAQACKAVALAVSQEVGGVDILVNNAGILIREGIDSERAEANWKKTFDVNVQGTFNVTYSFLPSIRETRGSIINVASIASFAGQAGPLAYAPTKGAIKLFTQSLAAELALDGVRVNAIAPGVIETAMSEFTRREPERLQRFMTRIPMGRVGQPQELLGPVVFLASAMSSYVTGVTLPVDGGFLAI
jgi:NAD(P)-dependent dehydrogenase (short-subunit alcohol dehydrogenase family)